MEVRGFVAGPAAPTEDASMGDFAGASGRSRGSALDRLVSYEAGELNDATVRKSTSTKPGERKKN